MKRNHYTYVEHDFRWAGLNIKVRYCEKSFAFDTTGNSHLEVHCLSPLPITPSGYVSRFLPYYDVDNEGGPANFVKAWLDQEANKKKTWKEFLRKQQIREVMDKYAEYSD